ncbi:unnamed protein product, partial [Staurois parvus]
GGISACQDLLDVPPQALDELLFAQQSGDQGWTDNSWGPRAIGIMGPLCPCPSSKKPMKKVAGASHGAPY